LPIPTACEPCPGKSHAIIMASHVPQLAAYAKLERA